MEELKPPASSKYFGQLAKLRQDNVGPGLGPFQLIRSRIERAFISGEEACPHAQASCRRHVRCEARADVQDLFRPDPAPGQGSEHFPKRTFRWRPRLDRVRKDAKLGIERVRDVRFRVLKSQAALQVVQSEALSVSEQTLHQPSRLHQSLARRRPLDNSQPLAGSHERNRQPCD